MTRSYDVWKTTDPSWDLPGWTKPEPRIASHTMCLECEGRGTLEVGRRGGNDPDLIFVECDICDGAGEVEVEEEDAEA